MDVKTGRRGGVYEEGGEQGSVKNDSKERSGLGFCWSGQGTAYKRGRNSEKDANYWVLSNVQLQPNDAMTRKCAGTCVSPYTRGHRMVLAR